MSKWGGKGSRRGSRGRCVVPTMTERCSLWSALSAAACCFYRGSFMQVQVSADMCVFLFVCMCCDTRTRAPVLPGP